MRRLASNALAFFTVACIVFAAVATLLNGCESFIADVPAQGNRDLSVQTVQNTRALAPTTDVFVIVPDPK